MRHTWQRLVALFSLLAALLTVSVPTATMAQTLPAHQAAVTVKSAAHAKKTTTKAKKDTKKSTKKSTTKKSTKTKVNKKTKTKVTKKTVKSKAKKAKKKN
jgi:Ni/Co efflux regulator RcnB